eukprot:scaffold22596_cov131-Cylindrotheca_fusiformis.AAC.13
MVRDYGALPPIIIQLVCAHQKNGRAENRAERQESNAEALNIDPLALNHPNLKKSAINVKRFDLLSFRWHPFRGCGRWTDINQLVLDDAGLGRARAYFFGLAWALYARVPFPNEKSNCGPVPYIGYNLFIHVNLMAYQKARLRRICYLRQSGSTKGRTDETLGTGAIPRVP